MSVSSIPVRPRDVVADAIAALVDAQPLGTWSGAPAALYAALDLVTTAEQRAGFAWPRTVAAFAARFPHMVDALWAHGLRMTRTPGEVIVERLRPARGAA